MLPPFNFVEMFIDGVPGPDEFLNVTPDIILGSCGSDPPAEQGEMDD